MVSTVLCTPFFASILKAREEEGLIFHFSLITSEVEIEEQNCRISRCVYVSFALAVVCSHFLRHARAGRHKQPSQENKKMQLIEKSYLPTFHAFIILGFIKVVFDFKIFNLILSTRVIMNEPTKTNIVRQF